MTTTLTARQAAELLDVSTDRVFQYIHAGSLTATTSPTARGGKLAYAIDAASVQTLLATRPARKPRRHLLASLPALGEAHNRVARLVAAGGCEGYRGLAAAVIALALDDASRMPEAQEWLDTTGAHWLDLLGGKAA